MALIKCWECGHDVSTEAVACPNCGAPLKNLKEGQTHVPIEVPNIRNKNKFAIQKSTGFKKTIFFIILVALAFISWFLMKKGSNINELQRSSVISDTSTTMRVENDNVINKQLTSENTTNIPTRAPSRDEIILSPFELFKNPFQQKNSRVKLNPVIVPVLLNGQLISWTPGNQIIGMVGIRFDRMLSQNQALYDIIAMDSQAGYRDNLDSVGQMLIILNSTTDITNQSSGPLSYSKFWEVEPLGTIDGTNSFGGTISIPAIKFLGYEAEEESRARMEVIRRAQEKEEAERSARMEAERRAQEEANAERAAEENERRAQEEAEQKKEREQAYETQRKRECENEEMIYRSAKDYIPPPGCEKWVSPRYEEIPPTKMQQEAEEARKKRECEYQANIYRGAKDYTPPPGCEKYVSPR